MIFLCYRRDDSIGHTGRLYDRLTKQFGADQVFMDVNTIEPGEDFIDAIQKTVAKCDIEIVVIGKSWLKAADQTGRCRLHNPEDFVRLEILAAMDRKIRIIPVLVSGAAMPRSDELPDALVPLTRRSAFELSDQGFHPAVDRLIAALEKTLQSTFEDRRQQDRIAAEGAERLERSTDVLGASVRVESSSSNKLREHYFPRRGVPHEGKILATISN